jgi:hypothetical protein
LNEISSLWHSYLDGLKKLLENQRERAKQERKAEEENEQEKVQQERARRISSRELEELTVSSAEIQFEREALGDETVEFQVERERTESFEQVEREIGRSEREKEEARRSFLGRSITSSRDMSQQEIQELKSGKVRVSGEFATPQLEIPVSEFELPLIRESISQKEREKREREVEAEPPVSTRLTQIFQQEVGKKLEQLESEGILPAVAELDELLNEVMGETPERRDRAIAFYQTLVLKSIEVITVKQEKPYGDIIIAKGEAWGAVEQR